MKNPADRLRKHATERWARPLLLDVLTRAAAAQDATPADLQDSAAVHGPRADTEKCVRWLRAHALLSYGVDGRKHLFTSALGLELLELLRREELMPYARRLALRIVEERALRARVRLARAVRQEKDAALFIGLEGLLR